MLPRNSLHFEIIALAASQIWPLLLGFVTGLVISYLDIIFADRCEIKEVTKVEGEASANNRKAKLFFFYEWELKASWKGNIISNNII